MFDVQVLYIQQIPQLEQVLYNDISKEEIDRLFSVVRRTDLQVLVTKIQQDDSDLIWVDASIANIDLRTTTREIKELKLFGDKFQSYHKELREIVLKEHQQMKTE